MKTRRARRWVLLLALLGSGGCQFLQNEFFFLDKAAPSAAAPERAAER